MCSAQATLGSISVQSSAGDAVQQFTTPAGPATPLAIGQEMETFTVFFQPTTQGIHSAQLVFSEGSVDTLVPVTGTGVAAANEMTFHRGATQGRSSCSLRGAAEDDEYTRQTIAADAADFFDAGAGVDYRVAFTTDDDEKYNVGAEFGRLLPCPTCTVTGLAPTIVSPASVPDGGTTPDPATVFSELFTSIPGEDGEPENDQKHLYLGLYNALQRGAPAGVDFFRAGAFFSVVNDSSTNQADQSSYGAGSHPTPWFVSFFTAFFPNPAFFTWDYVGALVASGDGLLGSSVLPPNLELDAHGDERNCPQRPGPGLDAASAWHLVRRRGGESQLPRAERSTGRADPA